MENEYKPSKILRKLSSLKQNFYPLPVEIISAKGMFEIKESSESNHLSKDDLQRLWSISGDVLHRKSFSKLYKKQKYDPDDFSDIFSWSEKITGLLSNHKITTIDNKRVMLVSLIEQSSGKQKISVMNFSAKSGGVAAETFQLE